MQPSLSKPSSRTNSVEGRQLKTWQPILSEASGSSQSRKPNSPEMPEKILIHDDTFQQPSNAPSSPESDDNFQKSLQIAMKDLIGDAVGNMSISPSSRDIVLAARRGLFIIDLENPLSVPRFLPQGGTWDVADVQWNPHNHRAEYVVSTSSEKLLIWNLNMGGKTSIQHVLHAHYRAITDINWHTTEADIVVSTGIDGWLWGWDLRETRKPAFGFSPFGDAGTQVKWHRHDPNLLASSHSNHVLIWDRRKGAVPMTTIKAHTSKIYGIDWSHNSPDEIVTCSLDRSIKVWNTKYTEPEQTTVIHTTYPVWRARNLPFGPGILSLPQRGETTLEMYSLAKNSNTRVPIERFEGHTDVVKEFVWRKGGNDNSEFQLITWSKDRTLRFWPIDSDLRQKLGSIEPIVRGRGRTRGSRTEHPVTFRNPPSTTEYGDSLMSAPVGHRGILAEVRAIRTQNQNTVIPYPPVSQLFTTEGSYVKSVHPTSFTSSLRPSSLNKSGTMSRGTAGAKSSRQMDAFTWLSNVKVTEGRRGSSSGPGSENNSVGGSRLSSRSRDGSADRRRSDSRGYEERGESLQLTEELTSVLKKLSASKIKMEKGEFAKRRAVTLGLHGPWGEHSSVFIRVTFVFPKDYPQATFPNGIPTVELERNPLILPKDRAFILRRLKTIRERRRPCLEACLRFLLFAEEGDRSRMPIESESSSSDDDEGPRTRRARDFTVSLLRNNKNLAEPRTTQGSFGPNGELVCFFRDPPRIVRNVLRGSSESPENASTPSNRTDDKPPLQSPSVLTDAIRRLALSASDRYAKPTSRQDSNGERILRLMTNLMTHSSTNRSNNEQFSDPGGARANKNYALLYAQVRHSSVLITNTTFIAGSDKMIAKDYIFLGDSVLDVCDKNVIVARKHARYDHERVFRTLGALFSFVADSSSQLNSWWYNAQSLKLVRRVVDQLLDIYKQEKDVQMLGMVSMIVLQVWNAFRNNPDHAARLKDVSSTSPSRSQNAPLTDYFNLSRTKPTSPRWAKNPPTPTSTSVSSRGSWSSQLVRQLMSGMQEQPSSKDHAVSPITPPPLGARNIPHPRGSLRGPDSPYPLRNRSSVWKDQQRGLSKSWNESSATTLPQPAPGSRGRSAVIKKTISKNGTRVLVIKKPSQSEKLPRMYADDEIEELVIHVQVYAEFLFRWQFYHKRLELLKAIHRQAPGEPQHDIDVTRICPRCSAVVKHRTNACDACFLPISMPACTVCRLPIRGLAHTCIKCLHVSHIMCWRKIHTLVCPSGCGCQCNSFDVGLDIYDLT